MIIGNHVLIQLTHVPVFEVVHRIHLNVEELLTQHAPMNKLVTICTKCNRYVHIYLHILCGL